MAFIGVDVSKKKLDLCWLRDPDKDKVKTRVFNNEHSAYPGLLDWLIKQTGVEPASLHVYMEATGIYHEPLAQWLHEVGVQVYVVNPARVREYARSMGNRGKTDKKDSVVLARYGTESRVSPWQPEPADIRELRQLSVRLETVRADIQREQNRREKAAFSREPRVVASIDQVLVALQQEARRLEQQIDDHFNHHDHLKHDKALLESIPGIGPVVSRHLLVMLRGQPFKSARQAAAFLGLVPMHWESGTSVSAPPRISKAGNPRMRRKLYMAATVAIQYNPIIKQQNSRLRARGKAPMAAIAAAMRKLVHIAYGVLRTQTRFQPQPA
jgi:transposase